MKQRAYILHALSPLHPGTGQGIGAIDLPIARMRATGCPFVPGSSLKGVLRDLYFGRLAGADDADMLGVFGPEPKGDLFASAITVSDARLLALPVRSYRGTFAWVSSPLLLSLAARELPGAPQGQLSLGPKDVLVGSIGDAGSLCVVPEGKKLYLEDLDFNATASREAQAWAERLEEASGLSDLSFARRFAIVHDDVMAFLWEFCTQLDVRNRIDPKTGVVADGALWNEEALPPETLLLGRLLADKARNGAQLEPDAVLDLVLSKAIELQVGGHATVGRGLCRMVPAGVEP